MGALSLFQAVGVGLVLVALVLHLIGFVTDQWITADLDMNAFKDMIKASGPKEMPPGMDQIGLNIKLGLWAYCVKMNFGNLDIGSWGPSDGQDQGEAELPPGYGDISPGGISPRDMKGNVEMCISVAPKLVPGWMKAVRALGIISLLFGGCAFILTIYSFIGKSKGDRARLLPHFVAGISFAAGIFLLLAVIAYGAEYEKMIHQTMSMVGSYLGPIVKNIADHTHLGYSFALEIVASLFMIGFGLLVLIPILMGVEGVIKNPQNFELI